VRVQIILAGLIASAVSACDYSPATSSSPAASLRANDQAPSCQSVRGTVDAAFVSGNQIEGTIAGSVEGAAFATVESLTQSGGGAYHVVLRHRYATAGGEVHTTDEGVLTPIDPPLFQFNNRLTVVGGTGAFANATGTINAHGSVILGGAIELRYHGRVCGIGAP
jgi:hypothetical protein